jgi:hypothetical protein
VLSELDGACDVDHVGRCATAPTSTARGEVED